MLLQTTNSRRTHHGFTIMELLVTISIIAILMGMIIPVFSHMRERARITNAKITAKNLETAFRAYLDHYKVWQFNVQNGNTVEIEDDLVRILRGENPGGANPDNVAFYEFANTNYGDKAVDPWYPIDNDNERIFRARFDHNYDNQVDTPGGDTVYRPVIVWAMGGDVKDIMITSWD